MEHRARAGASLTSDHLRALVDDLDGPHDLDPVAPVPSQAKMFRCGSRLVAHANESGEQIFIAAAQLFNTSVIYRYGGARAAVGLWHRIFGEVTAELPATAYVGRLTFGFSVHAWGPAVPEMPAVLDRISARLALLDVADIFDGRPSSLAAPVHIGWLEYPSDSGLVETFDEVSRFATMASDPQPDAQVPFVHRFDPRMVEAMDAAVEVEMDLRRAIDTGEFDLFIQPIVALDTGEPVAAELLSRFDTEFLRRDATAAYVAVIEDQLDVVRFTRLTFERWLEIHDRFADRVPEDFVLSLNLSHAVFRDRDFDIVAMVRDAAATRPGMIRRLCFELTETADPRSVLPEAVDRSLRGLAALGVRIAVDDLGSGYGVLRLMTSDVAQAVKLDRSAAVALADPDRDVPLLAALVHGLGAADIAVVCEGIETAEELDGARRLAVPYGQGTALAAPMSVDDFADYLDRWLGGVEGPTIAE